MSGKNPVLYLSDGTQHTFDAESLTTEIATRQNAGLAFGEIGGWLSQLADPDPVLRKRHEDAAVLAELLADDQVTTAILARKNRVLNAPHFTSKAGARDGEKASPQAELVYERLAKDLERTNLRTIISGILDAPFYGMSPLELIWECGDGWWHIKDIVARPFHWFSYDEHNKPLFRGAQGFSGVDVQPLPPAKFVITTHQGTYDNPYGLRLLSRCLWPVAFKRGGMQFYAKFVERHGIPWVVGKAPSGATAQEKKVMASNLAHMVQDCVAAVSFGSEVQLLTPTSGQDLLHERFLSRQDKAISKLLMGQTLTIEMDGRNNSQAAATTHNDVAEGLAHSDKAMVIDAFNEIAWLYTQINMGADIFAPVFSYEEPKDLNIRAELDAKLFTMGVEFTAEHFQDNYNLKETEFILRTNNQANPPFQFSASHQSHTATQSKHTIAEEAQKRLNGAIIAMLPDVIKANKPFLEKIESVVTTARNFDHMQQELAKLLAPKSSPSELEKVLASNMFTAAGLGAATVQAEATEDN